MRSARSHLAGTVLFSLEGGLTYVENNSLRYRYSLWDFWYLCADRPGMRWTMKGAHAMLALRGVELSGLWDKFMQFWRQREGQRLYSTTAANDEAFNHACLA